MPTPDERDALLPEVEPPDQAELERWTTLAAPHRSPVVWAEGDAQAPVVVVLDNPGARKRAGVEWVCPTRDALRHAASEAGLPSLYVTWLAKFRPRRVYDKELVRSLGREAVEREIAEVGPKVVVGLGDVVVRTLLRTSDASVRVLRGQALSYAGFPFVVGYHPLAVHRRPNLRALLVEDLKRACSFLGSPG